jgi:hypothetical protein
MRISNAKLLAGAALSALLLAGCGGGDGVFSPPVADGTSPMAQTVSDVFAFISNLIDSNGENTDPIDINSLTMATDDTSGPQPLP